MDFLNDFSTNWGWFLAIGAPILFVVGVLSAIDALMRNRTSQGTIAWIVSLLTIPPLSVPLYWIFGHVRFASYEKAMDAYESRASERTDSSYSDVDGASVAMESEVDDGRTTGEIRAFEHLANAPLTPGNRIDLLVDGQAMFDALFAAIDAAESYVLAQFYIIHDDDIGTAFQRKLIAAAERGVTVKLLFDGVGSYKLPRTYRRTLKDAGVEIGVFSGLKNWLARFRLNFRNHRKIVVVDGTRGFVGGLNVGDEYLGRNPKYSPWRDTHLELRGPAVLQLQETFACDWYYAREEMLSLQWKPVHCDDGALAVIAATGPADLIETCGLLFVHAIESAERRVWIATPYFVPDGRVLAALQTAAFRGVDVRILMPRTSDSLLFKYVPYAYLPEVERSGAQVHLFEPGFMHQKVMLVDDDYATVGSANMDNRSFRLNFEVTCLVRDAAFAASVEAMLERDFERATQITEDDLNDRSLVEDVATQVTRLFAPIL